MRYRLKAAVAVLLVAIISFSTLLSASASLIAENLPIVYVIGKVDVIYENKDGRSDSKFNKTLYPVSLENLDLVDRLEEILPLYADAFGKEYGLSFPPASEQQKLDAWAKYGLSVYNIIGDLYEKLALNGDGEPRDNSGIVWDWDQNYRKYRNGEITEQEYKLRLGDIITDEVSPYGKYDLYDYTFHYDWRLDMYYNAEFLNEYINNVLEATGRDKCVLVSRCYGCNLVAAYLERYGSEKVDKNIIYCSTAEGTIVCSEMFSGNFELNSEGMAAYMDDLFFGEGSGILRSIIGTSIKTKDYVDFGTFSSIVNKIYSRISNVMMPKTLINSFASMPGYWSLVNDSYFTDAKNFVFGDKASSDYRKLVDKIDYYHYTVTNNAKKIFVDACENGMKYANIVKYGTQLAPMVKSSYFLGDGIVEVPSASFGATSVNIGESFSAQYLLEAERNGTLKYISPDATIDASTCVYPEYTWFVENIDHFDFPQSVDKLILAITDFDGQMSVFDNPKFPQFKEYEGEGNLVTWAGGLYLENSRDDLAGTLRKVLEIFDRIIRIFKNVISVSSLIFGQR